MKLVVCGAGPVGALTAFYAARRGYEVEVYEMRGDVTTQHQDASRQLGKSINITMSDRGFEALEQSGDPTLVQDVIASAIPVYAREVHGANGFGQFTSTKIKYHLEKSLQVVSRGGLRDLLLERLFKHPNVKVFFDRKLVSADMDTKVAIFADSCLKDSYLNQEYMRVPFDLLIGADGAHSAVRHHLGKYTNIDTSQKWHDIWWAEFSIPQAKDGKPKLNTRTLHVWPQDDFMFIALPNPDGTFTCNLFASGAIFDYLRKGPQDNIVVDFFQRNFPGVTPDLLTPAELQEQFSHVIPAELHSLRVSPVNYKNRGILVGDAAHAMVPFYGQGMNTGLEDVRILFANYLDPFFSNQTLPRQSIPDISSLLSEYSGFRQPDVDTMVTLALNNYQDMRTAQKSVLNTLRRGIEQTLQSRFPGLGWHTLYSRVAFSCDRFSEIQRKNDRQTFILNVFFSTVFVSASVLSMAFLRIALAAGGYL